MRRTRVALLFTTGVRTTAATGLLMGLLWLSEALPLGLTALIPLVVFPLTGIRTAEQAAAPYANRMSRPRRR